MPLNCEDIVRQALGRSMTETEVLDMLDEARALARKARAGRAGANANKSIRDWTAQFVRDKKLERYAARRAAEFQRATRLAAVNYALDHFQGMEWEGISALMVGSKFTRPGARLSVDSIRGGLAGKYMGGALTELEGLGDAAWKLLRKGSLDREIMEAMWSLDNPASPPFQGNPLALDAANILHKWQERSRLDENAAGAWIGRLPGYIMRQCHDADRIRHAGFEQWRDEMLARLDWSETAGGALAGADEAGRVDFLRVVYDNLITGIHELAGSHDSLIAAGRIGSLASRVSQHRTLHFKSGADFYAYNKRFGRGSLLEGVFAGLTKSANDIALMRVFGPSPQANLKSMTDAIKQVYKARGDVDSIRKLDSAWRRLDNQMKELDGSLNLGGNPSLAEVGRITRAIQSMSKLGGAMISGFSDVPLLAQEFKYQGEPFFKSMAKGLALFARGRGKARERRILSACGVFFDSMAGQLTAHFQGQALGGKMGYLMNLFFRANGLSLWTDAWRKSATLMMSHDLASLAARPFAELSRKRQRVLSLYNIDADLWELLRSKPMTAVDGRHYFTPELAEALTGRELAGYMQARGLLVSKERVATFREDVASRLRAYFKDRVQYAVLEPDARTGAIIHQGQGAGSVTGELLRMCMQFKSFPAVFLQRTLAREVYGHGADSLGRGLAQAVIPKERELEQLYFNFL